MTVFVLWVYGFVFLGPGVTCLGGACETWTTRDVYQTLSACKRAAVAYQNYTTRTICLPAGVVPR